MIAQQTELVGVLGGVGGDDTAVAPDVEILQRVEAVTGNSAEAATLRFLYVALTA